MKRIVFTVLLMCIAFMLSGCGDKDRRVLAKINDKVITLGEFNERIERR